MVMGPLVASVVYTAYAFGIDGRFSRTLATVFWVGAFPATMFLAVPTYVIVRDHGRLSLAFVCFTAGFIAVVPWLLLELLPSSSISTTSYAVGDVWMVQDGVRTAAGQIRQMRSYVETFLAGALGGAVFWLIAIRPLPKREPQQISAVHPPVPDGDRAP